MLTVEKVHNAIHGQATKDDKFALKVGSFLIKEYDHDKEAYVERTKIEVTIEREFQTQVYTHNKVFDAASTKLESIELWAQEVVRQLS